MLDEAEYASDTDESDEDYKPDGGDEHAASEVESDGEPDNDNDDEDDGKQSKRQAKKRAAATARKPSPITTKRSKPAEVETKCIEKDELDDDEDENEDALWASFLGNAQPTVTKPETNSKPKENQSNKTPTTSNGSSSKTETPKPQATAAKTEQTKIVTEIFDFAGEKVEIQKKKKSFG